MVSVGHFNSRMLEYAGPLVYFVGDALPNLTLEFNYDLGGPVVLTGSTVTVSISRLKGTTAIKTDTASLTDANHGICVFSWGSFIFNSPGTYVGQARIVDVDGSPLGSQKFLIEVLTKVPGL